MDEKRKAALADLLKDLSDEQRAKLAECKSVDELFDRLAEQGAELPDELLDAAAGGVDLSNTQKMSMRQLLDYLESEGALPIYAYYQ